ncbi:MAG: CCC motif membrane protein [Bacteroidales bacterium]|nr:CCC motif membrane protein [Bacteroidales bacterium]HPF01314.1 CCC motif membrane protein [Bacteroidales bacterium]
MDNQTPDNSPFLKPEIPNASSAELIGILSIVFTFFFTLAGLVLGIVAIVQARKAEETFNANPGMFNPYSLNKVKTGKTCGIIGVVLSGLIIVAAIILVVVLISVFAHYGTHSCH